MLLQHKSLELYGKQLFETAVVKPPLNLPNPMEDEACFIFVLEGRSEVISEIRRAEVKAQEAVLLKCGNYTARLKLDKEESNYRAMVIHLLPEVLKKIYAHEVPSFLSEPVDPGTELPIPVIRGNELLLKYVEGILFYFENPELATEELLVLKIKELFMLLMHTKNAPEVRQILSRLFSPRSYSLREIVEAHMYEDVAVSELAQLSNHSLSGFKRKFKEVYDESPAHYLRRKKLERACDLLMGTSHPIGQIAYDSGFNDLAHFSRCFKKYYRMSPSQFRLSQTSKQMA